MVIIARAEMELSSVGILKMVVYQGTLFLTVYAFVAIELYPLILMIALCLFLAGIH